MVDTQRVRYDFMTGTTDDNPLLFDATTFNSAELAQVPEIVTPQYAVVIFDPTGVGNGPERAYIIDHAAGATTADLTRGREGGVGGDPVEHAADTFWAIGPVASDYIQVVTSDDLPDGTDNPGLPFPGQGIYVVDDDAFYMANTALNFQPPWNLPWGYIALAVNSGGSDQTISSGGTDLQNLTVTWTGVKNRRYKVTTLFQVLDNFGGTDTFAIVDGGNAVKRSQDHTFGASYTHGVYIEEVFTASAAGSLTRKTRCTTVAGTIAVQGGSTNYGQLLVEDIGPGGAPT